jgi:hypothetical protein
MANCTPEYSAQLDMRLRSNLVGVAGVGVEKPAADGVLNPVATLALMHPAGGGV